jgi:DNA (cytosine-5)-methyltransferase 1
MGYHRAGFDVVGVDHKPQPRYPFEFHCADAFVFLEKHGQEFDVIHASPPCQAYSRLRHLPWLRGRQYPALIEATRSALLVIGKPYIIENVSDAPLFGAELCGVAIGLNVSRHRRFEFSNLVLFPSCPGHRTIEPGRATLGKRYRQQGGVTGVLKEISRESIAGHVAGIALARKAMGIHWMNRSELTQAIPPAYTEWIGRQILAVAKVDGA